MKFVVICYCSLGNWYKSSHSIQAIDAGSLDKDNGDNDEIWSSRLTIEVEDEK